MILKSRGFTFIEIMVVLAIIGVMTTIVVPRLFYRSVATPLDTFAVGLNALIQAGVLEAIRTDRLHRVFFDFEKKKVTLEAAQKKDADPLSTTTQFAPVSSVATVLNIPEDLDFRHFYIGTVDEMGGARVTAIHFFIGPDGSVQDVTIEIKDVEQDTTITLMTNPFSGQLVMYDAQAR